MADVNKAEFLSKLFIKPVSDIIEWNSHRSKHDQKQLVMFLNSLFKFYVESSRSIQSATVTTDCNHVGADPDELPTQARLGNQSDCSSVASRLSRWLRDSSDGSSVHNSNTSCTSDTRFSSLSNTTAPSTIPFALTTNARNYLYHRRAFAINRRKWQPQLNHNQSTLFSPIFPRRSLHRTQSQTSADMEVNQDLLKRVFHQRCIDFIKSFFTQEPTHRRSDFLCVIRAIDSLGRLSQYDTSSRRQFEWAMRSSRSASVPCGS